MHTLTRTVSLTALTLALAPLAWGAGKASPALQAYQQERAHCMSGKSQQDKATCLKEAQAAYQEARRDGLNTQGDSQLSRNATDRCGAQPAADRAACMDRIQGAGSTQGSVKGGGLIRQTETKTP